MSTPMRRMHANERSRRCWYSTSDNVRIGATVIESPVWTPMGSTFSMPQMMMQLSALSRTTSSSYSFHPAIDRSTKISLIGDAANPVTAMARNASSLSAMPVPAPPRM